MNKNLRWKKLIVVVVTTMFAALFVVRMPAQTIPVNELNGEVRDFLAREVAVHFKEIRTFSPLPDRVNGSLTVGEYTWGSFMRVLAAQSDVTGNSVIAGRDTARAIAEMGLFEVRQGGKAFSQLYAAQALRHFGTDLSRNKVWQSMTPAEQTEWSKLLDATRIYDPKTKEVINLPENYLGVAARIAAYGYEFGILSDRAFLDSLIERAAKQFTDGAIYADDDLPNGRYDRYSNEYARFCWKAAEVVGRRDILDKLRPSIKTQTKLWWDLVSEKGYGYNWGRSQGLVSYLDTLEIVAFLGENPEFRPAAISELAALYYQAWRWIRTSYLDERHTFDIFAFGRGNYAYISLPREFQQISTSFAKIIVAHDSFYKTLSAENVTQFPVKPKLGNIARFEFFAREKDKQSGVWLVRQGNLRFALPITTGTKPAMSDYLAAPFGLAGFAAPVEEIYPSFVPFFELPDGHTYAASEGASRIVASADGQSLAVLWDKFGRIGTKSGARFEIGIKTEVVWKIVGNKLIRSETLTADKDIIIRNWRFAVPTTADRSRSELVNNRQIFVFDGSEGTFKVNATADWHYEVSTLATGNSRLGKGVLRPIPLHLVLTANEIRLTSGKPRSWQIETEVVTLK